MLSKLVSIKNVGRFRNSAAGGDTQLRRRSFVVGPNGFGKTTICAILRSLKSGDPALVVGRKTLGVSAAPVIDILTTAGMSRFDGSAWSTLHPDIAVFDGQFVADNIHSGEVVDVEHKRNLYRVIIGDDGVRLAEEDTALAAESRAKTSDVTAAVRALNPHLPSGMKVEAYVALAAVADIDVQIAEQEKKVASTAEAATISARAGLSEFPAPALDAGFGELLRRTLDDVAQDAEQQLATHLTNHSMAAGGAEWIATGVEYARGDDCPFCGQDIRALPLVAAFRSVFSDSYKTLKQDIADRQTTISRQFGDALLARFDTIAAQNNAAIEFWTQHCTFEPGPLQLPEAVVPAARSLGAAALALLGQKLGAPLDAIQPDAVYTAAVAAYEPAQHQLATANQAIRTVNGLIAAKKAETAAANLSAAQAELARLKAVKARHTPEISQLCDDHSNAVIAKAAVDARKDAVRQQLDTHTKTVVEPYERRINALLQVFNAGFSIAKTTHAYPGGIATSSYQLVINSTAVDLGDSKTPASRPSFKNTLSAGDRTTLAMAFFIADLERDQRLANKIIVFDDPFNSQDAFRRRQTVHEITRLAGQCTQVLVLSHDATFLKQLWDKAPPAERTSLALVDHRAQGTKIMPIDIEQACRGRTATDIDDLQAFLSTGAGGLLDIIRKMRVVLEAYCRTTWPASFAATDWLGDMVRKIREGGNSHPAQALYDELDQINDYSAQYHHGEDGRDATPDQIDPTELTGYVTRTLRIVNALQA